MTPNDWHSNRPSPSWLKYATLPKPRPTAPSWTPVRKSHSTTDAPCSAAPWLTLCRHALPTPSKKRASTPRKLRVRLRWLVQGAAWPHNRDRRGSYQRPTPLFPLPFARSRRFWRRCHPRSGRLCHGCCPPHGLPAGRAAVVCQGPTGLGRGGVMVHALGSSEGVV